MANFFRVKMNYETVNPENGELSKKSTCTLIEGVNYYDAEMSSMKFAKHFNLDGTDGFDYDIVKMKMGCLLVDTNNAFINIPTDEDDELNGLCFVGHSGNNFEPQSEGAGLFKVAISYKTLESKKRKETLHIFTKDIDTATQIGNKYIARYLDTSDGAIINIKLEPQTALLISKEIYETAKEIYNIVCKL